MKNVSAKYAQQYRDFCKIAKKSVRQGKEHWIHDQCEQADKGLNIGNTRQAYRLIQMLGKKPMPRVNVLRNQEGEMLQSKNEMKQRWIQYCSSFCKDHEGGEGMAKELEEITPPNNDDSHDILYSEVEEAIKTRKRNKSPGSDGITAELLQAVAWCEGAIPEQWGKSILVPISKKRDLSNCSSYRTISLINHTEKILSTVLLNRLESHLDPYLAEEQAGFRKDRSTVHQILAVRLLAEKVKRQGKKIFKCFIDFRKAFDAIKHEIIRCRNKDGHPTTKDLRKSTVG